MAKRLTSPGIFAAILLIAGCTASAGRPPVPSPPGAAAFSMAVTPAPGATASPRTAEDVPADPPAGCHVTVPGDPAFVPPKPYRKSPPALYHAAWYGSDRLWTMVDLGGEVWAALPHDSQGFSQKTFWWSKDFDLPHELQPAITVVGRRLDVPGPTFSAGDPGTNGFRAFDDIGEFMLVGVDVPTPGCWQITATYRGADLSVVVWVDDD
jgi:hypothetical protein